MRHLSLLPLIAGCALESASSALPLGDDAASCGSCHVEHTQAWLSSRHAESSASPVLAAMLPEVEIAWGVAARARCESCHAPGHSSDEGIGCLSCHAAVGNRASRDGLLVVDARRPLIGPFSDPEPTPAHASRASGFLVDASSCGTCHELTGPGLVDEPTFTEFLGSPAAREGLTCVDCHMEDAGERAIATGSPRVRRVSSHAFVGFDPPWGASPDEAIRAAERTRALLAEALSLRVVSVPGGIDVIVTNVGAGHSVPTGASFLRDVWVDVEHDGEVVASRVLAFGDVPMRGTRPVALLTDADRVEPFALAAGASRRVFVPVGDTGDVVLRARAIRPAVLARLGLAARSDEVPTHEVARAPF